MTSDEILARMLSIISDPDDEDDMEGALVELGDLVLSLHHKLQNGGDLPTAWQKPEVRCKHGIRNPHPCDDCLEEVPTAEAVAWLQKELGDDEPLG